MVSFLPMYLRQTCMFSWHKYQQKQNWMFDSKKKCERYGTMVWLLLFDKDYGKHYLPFFCRDPVCVVLSHSEGVFVYLYVPSIVFLSMSFSLSMSLSTYVFLSKAIYIYIYLVPFFWTEVQCSVSYLVCMMSSIIRKTLCSFRPDQTRPDQTTCVCVCVCRVYTTDMG